MLKGLHSVLEYVLRHVAKVEVDVAARRTRVVQEGVHHPELDELDVLLLKVVDGELAHDSAPTAARIFEASVGVQTRRNSVQTLNVVVVRTALSGVKLEVKGVDIARLTRVEGDVGEHLSKRNHALVVVARDGGVVANVLGSDAGSGEERVVDHVPSQASPVVVRGPVVGHGRLRKEVGLAVGHRGELPGGGSAKVDCRLTAFEVVEVGGRLAVYVDNPR